MSTYKRITRHPNSGKYESATWHDDYFAPHVYGVGFADGIVYPVEMVNKAELKEFWVNDILDAFKELEFSEELRLDILNAINAAYKERWKRDPVGGEGAVESLTKLLAGYGVKFKSSNS